MQKTTCISFSLYNSFSFDFGVKFSDSSCTYEVLKFGDLLFQNVSSHFIVFYHTADLQLFDAVADRNQLRSSPQEAVHLYGAHALLQLRHFGLVIPLINEKPYIWNWGIILHTLKMVSVEVLVQVWRPAWRIWRWGLVFWLSSGHIPSPSLLWYALPPHLPHHCQTGQYRRRQRHYVPQPWASEQEQPSDKTICRLWMIDEFGLRITELKMAGSSTFVKVTVFDAGVWLFSSTAVLDSSLNSVALRSSTTGKATALLIS